MRILIAESDPHTLLQLESSLTEPTYEIILAHNGPEAWRLATATPSPDIAVLAENLPDMDGLEICRRLHAQKERRFIFLILLAPPGLSGDLARGLDAGANDYITNPFYPNELKSRVALGARIANYENTIQLANERLQLCSQNLEQLAQERAQQLVRADRMIVLGTMAAGIAHEINNPLTIVQGNLGLLKHFWRQFGENIFKQMSKTPKPNGLVLPEKPDIAEMIANAEKAVRHLRDVVDGMRTLSHGGGGKVEALDPLRCLQDAVQICLSKTKNLCPVKIEAQEIPFRALANPVQITQILVNLIANAADALAQTPGPAITARAYADLDQRRLCLSVQDNGPGIPPEILDKIWNPLFTTKPMGQGTGLGLAICRKIAENHNGTLQVKSLVGQGSTFTLCLPNESEFVHLVAERQESVTVTASRGTSALEN
jgi:two-component system, NtrC family, sensor kinase